MKYMTFNSSCAYAGLANMLEKKGIDVEDYEIALEMKLPFMIDKSEDGYIAGPMLQQKKWFDVFLNAHGYEISEEWINSSDIFDYLQGKDTAMLELIGQDSILKDMKVLQKAFVQVALKEKRENAVLSDYFDMALLNGICDSWKKLIKKEIE